ncbi:MAG: response regulator transcription factor, partial [Planctomycetaceae bacterium]
MSRRRVLVVEDDAAIRRGIVDALEYEGYQPLEAERGDAGLRTALSGAFDLVLLDLVLPGLGGLDVLREVRLARPTLPVIILTARGEEADRVQGLKLGADDYVVKPFSVRELTARVEAVLRRSAERPGDIAELPLPHA